MIKYTGWLWSLNSVKLIFYMDYKHGEPWFDPRASNMNLGAPLLLVDVHLIDEAGFYDCWDCYWDMNVLIQWRLKRARRLVHWALSDYIQIVNHSKLELRHILCLIIVLFFCNKPFRELFEYKQFFLMAKKTKSDEYRLIYL